MYRHPVIAWVDSVITVRTPVMYKETAEPLSIAATLIALLMSRVASLLNGGS